MRTTGICFFLALLVSVTLFAGGARESSSATGGITEITQIVWDRGSIPPAEGTLMDNWWTRYVNEQVVKMGIKVNYVTVPQRQEAQLLSTMLAAGNAPDISKTNEIPLMNAYLSGGGITDITDMVEKYGSNIKSLYGPEILDNIKYKGGLYWFPQMRNGIDVNTIWIRKDWLDAMGMKSPTTIDEFYQVLKAVKEKDPGKRGSSLIPFGMRTDARESIGRFSYVFLGGFAKQPFTPEKMLIPWPMWPEAREGYRYMNKLYSEGLLSDIFLTDRDDSLIRQSITRGDIFAFCADGHYPYRDCRICNPIENKSLAALLCTYFFNTLIRSLS